MMHMEHVLVDGLDIAYADSGEGQAIVFLHGWGMSADSFEPLLRELSDFRTIAISLPGFGGSERPHAAWEVSDYARFVAHFLAALSIEPFLIVGHSFGGRIAIKGVGTRVFSAQKLVLIASAGVAEASFRGKILGGIGVFARPILALPFLSFLKSIVRRYVGSRDYQHAGPLRETFVKVVGESLEADARAITVPTLLIWGDRDMETPLTEGKTLHDCIASSRLEVIPGAGHFVFQEAARDVARLLREFV